MIPDLPEFEKLGGYEGNPNLKKCGAKIAFTPEMIVEYQKCAVDPVYFMRTYCKIVSLDHGVVNFDIYPPMEKYVQSMQDNRFTILLASRQVSKTTTTVGFILWYSLFTPNVSAAILANKQATAHEIMSRYRFMYENLPLWLQHGIKVWNAGNIELESGSKVRAAATSKSGIRSGSINLLYIDEMAFIPENIASDFFASVYPTISSGKTTKIVVTSTPKGLNHFYDFWDGAIKKTNGFNPIKVMWHEIPGRDQQWADEQLGILGEVRYRAEVECEFVGSTKTLIAHEKLESIQTSHPVQSDDSFKVFKQPDPEHTYIAVVDPSEGASKDYTAISVIDISCFPFEIVATYRNNTINPLMLPNVIEQIGKQYNNAFVLMEINKGEAVAYSLWSELEYENIIPIASNVGRNGGQIPFGQGRTKFGVVCNHKVKQTGCMTLKTMVENDKIIINDREILSELINFSEKDNGTYSADYGKHDDLVMTLVLFSWLTTSEWFSQTVTNGEKNSIRMNLLQSAVDNAIPPIGFLGNRSPDVQKVVVEHDAVWTIV